MYSTYFVCIDFFSSWEHLSSIFQSHSIYLLYSHSSTSSHFTSLFSSFQKHIHSHPFLYFIYQFPKSLSWKQHLILWTNYDDKIFEYKENLEFCEMEKGRYLEYQKMDYYKLKMIASNDFLSYIIYHSSFSTPYHILFQKKKYHSIQPIPHFLLTLSFFHFTKSVLPIKYKMIHLEHRKDREIGFREDERKHDILYEIVNGIVVSKEENVNEYREKMWRKGEKYIRSALGCKRSHMKIMEEWIEENRDEYMCIMEDDFRWYRYENIKERLKAMLEKMEEKDKEWRILYITCNKKNRKRHQKDDFEIERVEEGDGFATTGYILNPKYIPEILQICQNEKEEIDVIYTKCVKNRYSLEPYLGYPCESFSDILQEDVHYDFQY